MFKAVYKCRLCKELVEVPVSNVKARELAELATGANMFVGEESLREIHKCKTGSRGILDLLGFRFYGD